MRVAARACTPSTASASQCAAARRSRIVGESGCGKSTLARLLRAADRADRRPDPYEGRTSPPLAAKRAAAARARDAVRLPGPVRLAQPAHDGRSADRRTAARPHGDAPGRGAAPKSPSCSSRSGCAPSTPDAIRTSSPAASASASASRARWPRGRAADRRRAGLRARRVDPGAGPQPARRPEGRARPDADRHLPRPRRHPPHHRPRRGDVPRQPRRNRQRRRPLRRPRHPYTQALLEAVPVPEPARAAAGRRSKATFRPRRPPPGCRFHTRCAYAVERCAAEVPELRDSGAGRLAACHRTGEISLAGVAAGEHAGRSPAAERRFALYREYSRKAGETTG